MWQETPLTLSSSKGERRAFTYTWRALPDALS